jgi:hypothetical protein
VTGGTLGERWAATGGTLGERWAATGSPLEYWFFRTGGPGGVVLVDVILRRAAATAEVRVCTTGPSGPRLHRTVEPLASNAVGADGVVTVAGCSFGPDGSQGKVGAASWDLSFGGPVDGFAVPPEPMLSLGAMDLSLASWPRRRAAGVMDVGAGDERLDDVPATACHYWGRALAPRWLWLSAVDTDATGTAVEVTVLTSRVFGLPLPTPFLGYAWLYRDGRDRLVSSPIDGLVRRVAGAGGGPGVLLAARGLAGSWTVRAAAPQSSFVDLGEGIHQSLAATVEVCADGRTTVERASAALELRLGTDTRPSA